MVEPVALTTVSPEETRDLGEAIGNWLQDGDVLLLHGDLGAGKTMLAKGIAAALGVAAVVSSPSFALVNEYETGLLAPVAHLVHLDLFRLTDAGDLASIGFDDLAAPVDGITLVEWPERAADALPERYVLVQIEPGGDQRRHFSIAPWPHDEAWTARFADLRIRLAGRWELHLDVLSGRARG